MILGNRWFPILETFSVQRCWISSMASMLVVFVFFFKDFSIGGEVTPVDVKEFAEAALVEPFEEL